MIKHFLKIASICALSLGLYSCNSCIKQEKDVKTEVSISNFNEILEKDYSYKENPGYIFGDTHHGPWIKVDAINGNVTEIK